MATKTIPGVVTHTQVSTTTVQPAKAIPGVVSSTKTSGATAVEPPKPGETTQATMTPAEAEAAYEKAKTEFEATHIEVGGQWYKKEDVESLGVPKKGWESITDTEELARAQELAEGAQRAFTEGFGDYPPGETALKEYYKSETVRLPSGDILDKETYEELPDVAQAQLQKEGLAGFEKWASTQEEQYQLAQQKFEGSTVNIGTEADPIYVSKTFYSGFEPAEQELLKQAAAENPEDWQSQFQESYVAKQQADFLAVNVEVAGGQYIPRDVYEGLTSVEQQVLQAEGLTGLENFYQTHYYREPTEAVTMNILGGEFVVTPAMEGRWMAGSKPVDRTELEQVIATWEDPEAWEKLGPKGQEYVESVMAQAVAAGQYELPEEAEPSRPSAFGISAPEVHWHAEPWKWGVTAGQLRDISKWGLTETGQWFTERRAQVSPYWQSVTPWSEERGETVSWAGAGVMAGDILLPGYYTARSWQTMGAAERGLSLGLDVVSVVPFARAMAAGVRMGRPTIFAARIGQSGLREGAVVVGRDVTEATARGLLPRIGTWARTRISAYSPIYFERTGGWTTMRPALTWKPTLAIKEWGAPTGFRPGVGLEAIRTPRVLQPAIYEHAGLQAGFGATVKRSLRSSYREVVPKALKGRVVGARPTVASAWRVPATAPTSRRFWGLIPEVGERGWREAVSYEMTHLRYPSVGIVSRPGRRASAFEMALLAEAKAPYTMVRHPISTAKQIYYVGESIFHPRRVPLSTISQEFYTSRLLRSDIEGIGISSQSLERLRNSKEELMALRRTAELAGDTVRITDIDRQIAMVNRDIREVSKELIRLTPGKLSPEKAARLEEVLSSHDVGLALRDLGTQAAIEGKGFKIDTDALISWYENRPAPSAIRGEKPYVGIREEQVRAFGSEKARHIELAQQKVQEAKLGAVGKTQIDLSQARASLWEAQRQGDSAVIAMRERAVREAEDALDLAYIETREAQERLERAYKALEEADPKYPAQVRRAEEELLAAYEASPQGQYEIAKQALEKIQQRQLGLKNVQDIIPDDLIQITDKAGVVELGPYKLEVSRPVFSQALGPTAFSGTPELGPMVGGYRVAPTGAGGLGQFLGHGFYERFALASSQGARGTTPGVLAIREPTVVRELMSSGRPYGRFWEMERVLRPGFEVPSASQLLFTRSIGGEKYTIAVIGKPVTTGEVLGLKLSSARAYLKPVVTKPWKLFKAERALPEELMPPELSLLSSEAAEYGRRAAVEFRGMERAATGGLGIRAGGVGRSATSIWDSRPSRISREPESEPRAIRELPETEAVPRVPSRVSKDESERIPPKPFEDRVIVLPRPNEIQEVRAPMVTKFDISTVRHPAPEPEPRLLSETTTPAPELKLDRVSLVATTRHSSEGTVDGKAYYWKEYDLDSISQPVYAEPRPGYRFSHWTGDIPRKDAKRNPVRIIMDTDKKIQAVFVAVPSERPREAISVEPLKIRFPKAAIAPVRAPLEPRPVMEEVVFPMQMATSRRVRR